MGAHAAVLLASCEGHKIIPTLSSPFLVLQVPYWEGGLFPWLLTCDHCQVSVPRIPWQGILTLPIELCVNGLSSHRTIGNGNL